MKIEKVCETCGSVEVWVDALAEWDVDTQSWELGSTFDNSWCATATPKPTSSIGNQGDISMTHAQIRKALAWALREMERADQRLEQSETESIPSVAKMLKEDSSVAYRNAVLTIKEAASHLD
jgi:hypothetical protein